MGEDEGELDLVIGITPKFFQSDSAGIVPDEKEESKANEKGEGMN